MRFFGNNSGNVAIRLDPLLAERVVDFHVQNPTTPLGVRLSRDYRRAADRIYALPEPIEREVHFSELFVQLFLRLDFIHRVQAVFQEFPLIVKSIEEIVLSLAERTKDEGVDRARPQDGERGSAPRRAILRLQASRFGDVDTLAAHVRFHALQLEDLADPSFEYDGELPALSLHPVEQKAFAASYTEVWNLHTLSRLKNRGREAPADYLPPWAAPESAQDRTIADICGRAAVARLRHGDLVALALEVFRGRGGAATAECSLCRFPSVKSVSWNEISGDLLRAAIARDFPDIQRFAGRICGHCLERYELLADLETDGTRAA